jgi:hypothetical protein
MTDASVERIESAPALKRGVEVWYALLGGIGAWTVHLLYFASIEHWTKLHESYGWTMHAVTVLCVLATVIAMLLAWRLHVVASGSDPESAGDAGQLLFLAQLGLLIGAINLALILLEEIYALSIPHG